MAKNTKAEINRKRWGDILKKYGLTKEQWWAIYEEQDKKCFICRRRLKIGGKSTRLSVHTDHCHTTGKVRGLLCRRCNMDIVPRFEKNLEAALNLHIYLTREKHYGLTPGTRRLDDNNNSNTK